MKIIAFSPNKIIICGEHFVVYGAKAIAAPIDKGNKVILTAKKGEPKIVLKSNIGKAEIINGEFKGDKSFFIFSPIIKNLCGDKLEKIKETIGIEIISSNMPKGTGNSASIGIAIALSLLTYMKKNYDDEQLFNYGQMVDGIAHGGKPSGIDAKTISSGKPQKFYKTFNPEKFYFEDINIELPYKTCLLLIDTFKNKRETTAELIKRFAKANKIKKLPSELSDDERNKLLENYSVIFEKFLKNLKKDGNAIQLGKAMNENHELLKAVSNKEIEKIRSVALQNGAYGIKITGAGGKGGALIALVDVEKKGDVQNAIKEIGYKVFDVNISTKGPRIEHIEK